MFNFKKFTLDLAFSLFVLITLFLTIALVGFYRLSVYQQDNFTGNITTFFARWFDFPVAAVKTDRAKLGLVGLNFIGLEEYENNLNGLKHFYSQTYQVNLDQPGQAIVLDEIKKINLDQLVENNLIKTSLIRNGIYFEQSEVDERWQDLVSSVSSDQELVGMINGIYGLSLADFKQNIFLPQLAVEKWQEFLFNQQNIDKITRAKALDVKQKLGSGEDFSILAAKISDDTSKDHGGQLEYTGRAIWLEEFEQAAFALKEVGEISQPVKTKFGYHLIKLNDRRVNPITLQAEVKVSQILIAFPEQANILFNWLQGEKSKLKVVRLNKNI